MSTKRLILVAMASVGMLLASAASFAASCERCVVELRATAHTLDLIDLTLKHDGSKATFGAEMERVQHVRSFRDMGAGQIHYMQTADKGYAPGSMLVRLHGNGAGGTGWPSPLPRSLI